MGSIEATRTTDATEICQKTETKSKNDIKGQIFSKPYSFIPKMSLNLERVVEQNPRILDLREKLNEITRKKDRNVDKQTKGLINDITQQFVDKKDDEESGPYSLLFDLQTNPSTSFSETTEINVWGKPVIDGVKDICLQTTKNSTIPHNKSTDRLPNILNFDSKPLREFEYSCESELNNSVKKIFGTHSRSDLCLQLKSHIQTRVVDCNLSPNDNSLSKTNEENSLDDSLGILTPDQMDDICYLENAFSPTVEGLPIFCDPIELKLSPENGDTPSTDKTESNSAASTIQNDVFENTDCKNFPSGLAPIVSLETILNNDQILDSPDTPRDAIKILPNSEIPLNNTILIKSDIEDCALNRIEDELMPSIHSSILEPASSIAENITDLEIPLDCKHDNIMIVNRIDQTPSPEDLPLDSSDINGEISTYSQFSVSTANDSQTYSDSKNEYTKSMDTSKVSNSFITSITSITSLDGYQGDGEMSRPVSRGGDHSMGHREDAIEMDWQNVPVTRRVDPMTDSDFFTESDADVLDDHMQKGDRKAQVIDGALYGGKNGNGNLPLIVTRNDDSCMESSGVYTDFENHRSSPVFLNVIDDMSPEGSTPSTRSECSQKNNSTGNISAYFTPMQFNESGNISGCCTPLLFNEKQNTDSFNILNDDVTPKNTSKRNSLNSEKDVTATEKSKEEKRTFTLKKYKMPKRDVPSKLKSMLANKKTEIDNISVQSSPKAVKKTDRRENLLKKNTLDIKKDYKIKSFKDIKSKLECDLCSEKGPLQRSQTSCSVTRMLSSKSTNTGVKAKRYV